MMKIQHTFVLLKRAEMHQKAAAKNQMCNNICPAIIINSALTLNVLNSNINTLPYKSCTNTYNTIR